MQVQGLIARERAEDDERKVMVALTEKGQLLQADAAKIPELFVSSLLSDTMSLEELKNLRDRLSVLIDHLSKRDE